MQRFGSCAIFAISIFLFINVAYATHQVEYRVPTNMITTVGKFTTLQIDIKNAGLTSEYYLVTITAEPSNQVETTNPSITTKTLNSGESVSVFSNIRTLTDAPARLTIKIYRGTDLSHFFPDPPISISVQSKKFSLPEFGLTGFLQIMAIASVLYFSFGARSRASSR